MDYSKNNVTSKKTNTRVLVSWKNLKKALIEEAMKTAGYDIVDPPNLSFKVEVRRQGEDQHHESQNWFGVVEICEIFPIKE